MSPKRQRLILLLSGMAIFCTGVLLLASALRDNLVFFYTPAELAAQGVPLAKSLRIGGIVQAGSVTRMDDGSVRFVITDGAAPVPVHYVGLLPDLFREGQGVVAEGRLAAPDSSGVSLFEASRVLAKHDENYMPREVVDALKKSNRWRPAASGQ